MKSILRPIFLFCFLLPAFLFAQPNNKVRRDSLRRFHNTSDSNYVRKYPDRFIVTLSQSYREYDIEFWQTLSEDTIGWGAPQMKAGSNLTTGASIDFDKISFSFGLGGKEVSASDLKRYGTTTIKALSLSFSAYRFRVESSYRNYHGFYYPESRIFDTLAFDSTGIYLQNPSMNTRNLRVKTIFILNKRRFSYSSSFYNTQRQLKSAGSLLLVNNIYQNEMTSDSSFIPGKVQSLYQEFGKLNYFKVSGFSIGLGYSYNLVLWKTLYANLTLTSGFDIQHRDYNSSDGLHPDNFWKIGYAGDVRAAIGLNGKRCFFSLTFRGDYNNYVSKGIRTQTSYLAGDINIGYRFRSPHGKLVTKMKANKWYQML